MENPIKNIDFDLLKKQKAYLLSLSTQTNRKTDEYSYISGLLHLLDSIQDYAVDELGFDEDKVFQLEND